MILIFYLLFFYFFIFNVFWLTDTNLHLLICTSFSDVGWNFIFLRDTHITLPISMSASVKPLCLYRKGERKSTYYCCIFYAARACSVYMWLRKYQHGRASNISRHWSSSSSCQNGCMNSSKTSDRNTSISDLCLRFIVVIYWVSNRHPTQCWTSSSLLNFGGLAWLDSKPVVILLSLDYFNTKLAAWGTQWESSPLLLI